MVNNRRLIVADRQERYFRYRRIRRILTWGAFLLAITLLLAIEIVLVTLLKGGVI